MKPNYFDLNTREKRIYRARKKITDQLLLEFLNVMGENPDTLAMKLINQSITEGLSLDEIFYTGETFGYNLIARDIDEDTIELEFGYQAGFLAGDGNHYWLVFDDDGQVTIEFGEPWLS